MRKTVCFFLFLFCVGAAGAVTQGDFKQFLKNLGVVSVDIDQTRYVRALDKSFTSKSSAEFDKNKGTIKWKGAENSSFVSSRTAYKVNDGKGKSLSDLPYFSDIKEIVDEVLTGNISALEDVFDVTYSTKLILVPTISEISDMILKIFVDLDVEKLNSIEIFYRNGDKVLMSFRHKEINGRDLAISNFQRKKNNENVAEKH
ncbi:MAG: hypothetical protein J5821_00350 [Alphaproteobacteria bacterium]|nr:hypothetical protein [Alphaproteobacteria bacterium]